MTVDRAFARTVLARLRVGVLANTLRTPTAAVLIVALLIRLTGLTWGLPASDGWDDDGVAPRDFLAGVVMTYWPHHHYIYPPLQLIALTLVSAPVWVAALLRASSLEAGELVRAFIQVPTMTALAVAARATTIAMSLGLLWNVAKIAVDLTHSRRAGAWAAAACGVNAVFTYYSQTTNLDVPYLFWAVLALRTWMTAVVRGDLPRLRRVPVIAALAVATKDQAYALFVLGLPLALGAWLLVDRRARASARAIFRELAIGAAMGLSLLLVVDGAVSNPSGFAERIGTLLGSASQDHAYYAKTWLGRGKAILDTFTAFHEYYPWAFVPFAAFGCWVAFAAKDPARRAAGLTPLCFAL